MISQLYFDFAARDNTWIFIENRYFPSNQCHYVDHKLGKLGTFKDEKKKISV